MGGTETVDHAQSAFAAASRSNCLPERRRALEPKNDCFHQWRPGGVEREKDHGRLDIVRAAIRVIAVARAKLRTQYCNSLKSHNSLKSPTYF